MKTIKLQADLYVISGGFTGMSAALSAAQHGFSIVPKCDDRQVPGDNASGEIRMRICGAQGSDCRETGTPEEIMRENRFRNPRENFSVRHSILYGKFQYADRIRLRLNTSCLGTGICGKRIAWIKGRQSPSQFFYETVRLTLLDGWSSG